VTTAAAATIADLFDRHFGDVYGYVAFRVGGGGDEAAEVTQQVFAAAAAALRTLREAESARGWLLRIARNKVIDHYRRRGRIEHVPLSSAAGSTAALEDTERIDRALLVGEVMRRLPREQVDLLEDKYLRELSVRAMAAERQTSDKAVESALARARLAFRNMMVALRAAEESQR